MKKMIVMLAAVLVMALGLVGCASRNGNGGATHSPIISTAPSMTPSATVPNDGMNGGGAGGTNTPNGGDWENHNGNGNNGVVNNGNGTANNGTVNNGNGTTNNGGVDDNLPGETTRNRGALPNTGVRRG